MLLPIPLPGTELTDRLAAENRIYSTDHIGLEYYDGNFPIVEPDAPLTAENMQAAIRKIMGRFYRRNRMFSLGLHVLSFPVIGFYFHKIKSGWRRWYRRWVRNCYRAGGSFILRKWDVAFKKGGFPDKLAAAKESLSVGRQQPGLSGQYSSTPPPAGQEAEAQPAGTQQRV